MQVKPKFHLTQTIGTLSVLRPVGYSFELPDDEVEKALAAGLIETPEDRPAPKRTSAKERLTK